MKKALTLIIFAALFVAFVSQVYARDFYHYNRGCDLEDCPRRNQVNDIQNNVDEISYYDCGNPNCHRTDEHTHYSETSGHHHGNGRNCSHSGHHR